MSARDRETPGASGLRTTMFRVSLRRLEVMAAIGVHPHEQGRTQRVLVDVEIDVGETPPPADDRLGGTIDYQAVARAVEAIAREGHVQLVETLAQRVAAWCLEDPRVQAVRVRVDKPEALRNAGSAGCEIVVARGDRTPG